MFFATVFTAAALCPLLAVAQIYGPPPSNNPPPTSSAAVAASVPSAPPSTTNQINIDVAFNGNFVFNPTNVTAPKGSTVTFYFPSSPIDHSVTQSSFANPCTPLAANGSNPAGFDSGLTQAVQFNITIVDDTEPIWFFCKQVTHCGLGMVGSINAPTNGSNTYGAFLAAAQAIGQAGEPTVTDNGPVTGGVGGVASSTPTNIAAGTAGSGGSSDASRMIASSGFAMLGAFVVALFL